jgi:hypothetical protein
MKVSTEAPHLPSRPRTSGLPDLRINFCKTRAGRGFVAGRVGRVSEANGDGVGGLRLLRGSGSPHPRSLPATRFARGGRGEECESPHMREQCQ